MQEGETTVTDVLMRPFPESAIKQRQGGGGRMLSYLQGHTVIHRLIEATANQFDVVVTDLKREGDLMLATVALTIPGLGTRQHIGVQVMSNTAGGEDVVKGAITDAIKKAATLFGVGLELYGPDYESGEVEQPRQQYQQARPSGLPRNEATPKQISYLRAIAREFGLTEGDLEERAQQMHGAMLAALDRKQVADMIEQLQAERTPSNGGPAEQAARAASYPASSKAERPASEAQKRMLFGKGRGELNWTPDRVKQFVEEETGAEINTITMEHVDWLVQRMDAIKSDMLAGIER